MKQLIKSGKTAGIGIIMMVTTQLGLAQSGSKTEGMETLETKLVNISQRLLDAVPRGDTTSWHDLTFANAFVIDWDGTVKSVKEYTARMKPLPVVYKYTGNQVLKPQITVAGKTAVLTFIADEKLEVFGQVQHTPYQQTNTFAKDELGRWKLLACMYSEIAFTPPPVVTLDTAVLSAFTGHYRIDSNMRCNVSLRGEVLVIERHGSAERELYAETECTFFSLDRLKNRIIFEKDSSNKVVRMIERRMGGYNLVWHRTD